jgi:hypothetical protein
VNANTRSEETLKSSTVKVGDKVTMAGFPGTVTKVCEWSRAVVNGVEGVMVEVRLPGGIGCYPCSDLRVRS